jgi:filamentous hemagglutinin family protein
MMNYSKLYPQQQISIGNITTTATAKLLVRSIFTLGVCAGFTIPASAQITPESNITKLTPGAANTTDITEGTTSGTNLFHNFTTFNINNGQTANFKSDPGIQNILGRINNGQPSTINGTIQVNGGSTASTVNLYLLNPAGMIFGNTAKLDINGAFTATTARAIRFGNGEWFNALGGTNYPAIDPTQPIDFAFTDTPGSIFNAANLTTKTGQSITLVGGTVISTGDIKTNGGNISIATAPGGKYVQIKADGSILSLELPIADKDRINASNPTFVAPSLSTLLTGRIDSTATGVKIEGNVVKLVGDDTAIASAIAAGDTVSRLNRSISSGDVITRNLDTSKINKGGNIQIQSSQAILSGNINTTALPINSSVTSRFGGTVVLNAQTELKTKRIDTSSTPISVSKGSEKPNVELSGGNVNLSTQTKDIVVDSINTTAANDEAILGERLSKAESTGLLGGNVTIKAAGLFRLILGGIDSSLFGIIDIEHGSKKPFASGVTGELRVSGGAVEIPGFTFPDGASGSRGGIITSRGTNGSIGVIYKDQSFDGISIKGKTDDTKTATNIVTKKDDPNPVTKKDDPNPVTKKDDAQKDGKDDTKTVANNDLQKSKKDCTPNSTSVAANPTADPTRSAGTASAPVGDPCELVTGSASSILQVLNNRN